MLPLSLSGTPPSRVSRSRLAARPWRRYLQGMRRTLILVAAFAVVIIAILAAQHFIQEDRYRRDLRDHPDPPARWLLKRGPGVTPPTNAAAEPAATNTAD
jgi:hypothetical protein